jgi:hypothetical protein
MRLAPALLLLASIVCASAAAAHAVAAPAVPASARFLERVLLWLWFKPHASCDDPDVQSQWRAVQNNVDILTHVSATMHFIEIVGNNGTSCNGHEALFGDHNVCDKTDDARALGLEVRAVQCLWAQVRSFDGLPLVSSRASRFCHHP